MSPLHHYRDTLLSEIRAAARKRDTVAILNSARKLEALEKLIALEENPSASPTPSPLPDTAHSLPTENRTELSPKTRGRHYRENFVRRARSRGIVLQSVNGQIFRSASGMRVGIAYSREGTNRNRDQWFLGLPENQFDQGVLLCQENSGELTFFSLPKGFMDQHGSSLTSRDGQVKITVSRRSGEFFLEVPRQDPVSLEAYRNKFCGLE